MIPGMLAAMLLPVMLFFFISIASPWGIEFSWPLWLRVIFGTVTAINVAYCALALYVDRLSNQETPLS